MSFGRPPSFYDFSVTPPEARYGLSPFCFSSTFMSKSLRTTCSTDRSCNIQYSWMQMMIYLTCLRENKSNSTPCRVSATWSVDWRSKQVIIQLFIVLFSPLPPFKFSALHSVYNLRRSQYVLVPLFTSSPYWIYTAFSPRFTLVRLCHR